MKKQEQLWSVELRDEEYSGQRETVMGRATSAGDAEKKALRAVDREVSPKPYVLSVTFVGYITF